MATDVTKSVEDAEMTEHEEDKVVTMMDVLEEQKIFEEDANAVLGGSDDKNCTYSKGYIKRQALYACMTCCSEAKSDPNKRAGVCLACSLTCHENHELIELYTKRNFRCDCGNEKFKSHPCQLAPKKDKYNEENSYNQNFSGVYCICQRPYPDPECENEDVMIQCTVCEDWYHGTHLETTIPNSEHYTEMICKGCMEKCDFLHSYSHLVVNIESADVDVLNDSKNGVNTCNGDLKTDAITENNEKSQVDEDVTMAPKTEISPSDENIKETKNEAENTPNENDGANNSEDATISTVGANDENLEGPKDSTDVKMDENNSNNTNEQNVCNDEIKNEDNLNHSKDIVDEVQGDIEPKTAEKETEEKNTTEIDNDKVSKGNEENLEEKLLLDSENENNSSKNNLDITKTSQDKDKPKTDDCTAELANLDNPESQGSTVCPETLNSASQDEKYLVQLSKEHEVKNDNNVDSKAQDTGTNEVTEVTSIDNNLEVSKEDSSNHKGLEKRKLSTEMDGAAIKKTKLDDYNKQCIRPKDVKKVYKGATFWPSNFRQKLCTCNECLSMYKDLSVLFLIDLEDTVITYESLGKEKTNGKPSQYEKGLEALSSLDRIQQINALTEYNKMRDKLLDFLKSFKDRKEIVKEEDIKAFFAGMKPTKQPDGVYFCR